MSTKKLFVPSLADKVEELLKTYRLESVLTFENLKGRGELAPYMYVLSKRTEQEKRKLSLPGQLLVGQINQQDQANQKHSCLNFRFNGDLSNFAKLQIINNGFKNFLRTKAFDSTPMYQKDLSDDFTMEYYQDAFVDGHLINTSNKDKNKITHPSFFKSLMNSCLPLSHFFQIDALSEFQEKVRNSFNSQNLLGINFETEEQYPFILILDYRNKDRPRLEFIASSSYQAKKELYGNALCTYFGMIPKVKGININLFRYFFQTQLGNQIIQMSVRGNYNKLKAKVSSLLIPAFFEDVIFMPEHLDKSLYILHKTANEIAKYGVKEIVNDFEELKNAIAKLGQKYPWHILSLLQQFNQQFENIIDYDLNEKCIFENKQVIKTLIADANHPLTENPEVFIKIENHFQEDDLELVNVRSVSENNSNKLILENSKGAAVSLYSESSMIDFLEFLFSNAKGVSIESLLNYTKVPSINTLSKIMEQQLGFNDSLLALQNQTQSLMTSIINQQIYQSQIH